MAEKGFILSAEEELKLREPIDEYIGKIQRYLKRVCAVFFFF